MSTARTAIIHIGTEKTGTTTLQAALAQHREKLAARGIHFPRSPGTGWGHQNFNHYQLALLACREANGLTRDLFAIAGSDASATATVDRLAGQIDRELSSLPESIGTVVFSSEFLHSRVRRQAEVVNLKTFLDRHFAAYRIVCYLRPQDELATSLYSTALRMGFASSMLPAAEGLDIGFYDYERLLSRWGAVFGRQAMVVRIFSDEALVAGDVCRDFTAATGLGDLPMPIPRQNAGLSRTSQFLLRSMILRHQATAAGRVRNDGGREFWGAVARRLETLFPGASGKPPRAEAIAFFNRFAASNEMVRAAYFPDRATLFERSFDTYPTDGAGSEPTAQEQAEALLDLALDLSRTPLRLP